MNRLAAATAHGARRWAARCARALALVAALGGGAASAADGCSLSHGEPWREYRSRHFVIDASGWNGPPARLVRAFEEIHAAVLAALIAEPVEIPGKVHVILLPRQEDLVEYTGSRDVLGLWWVTPLGQPVIVTAADQVEDMPQVVAHELTHHVSRYLFPRQAFWFSEGLAQFVESVAKPDREGRRWAGGDPMNGEGAGSFKLPRMGFFVPALQARGVPGAYPAAWVLYRYLWNELGRELSAYQQYLMDGAAPDVAWVAAFPDLDFEGGKINRLDGRLAQYQRSGRGLRWRLEPAEIDPRFEEAEAPLGDLHLTLLALRLTGRNPLEHDRLRREALEEAAREDPDNPLVAAARAQARDEPLGPALRAAVARRPGDGRGWYLLGAEAAGATGAADAEREAALRKAVALWPDGAPALSALAARLTATGRAREAFPFADHAVEVAPWDPVSVSSLAEVALALSKCKEAVVLQRRAVEAAVSRFTGATHADPKALRARLGEIEERCAPPSAAAAPKGGGAAGGP